MANEKRLIDAKALEKQIKQAFEDTNPYAMGMMLRWIRKQTKVDAVEVVRCKDCKHFFYDSECSKHSQSGSWLTEYKFYTRADNFCSYGERKDNDT